MKITAWLNVRESEIRDRQFNIFIGISLGNKYFTAKHIRAYLVWALENTKSQVVVLIPDKIHAINYEVKNDYSKERALMVAQRKGDEVGRIVIEIMNELHIPKSKVKILRWAEIEGDSYLRMLDVFRHAFRENSKFRKTIIDIVKETPHMKGLNDAEHEKLSQYVIDELPMLIEGIETDGVRYELLPYPGFDNIDYLAIDLQEGKSFPEITKTLKIENKLRLIEAYAE